MAAPPRTEHRFLKRLLRSALLIGLAAGFVFPPLASLLIGDVAFGWSFMLSCLLMGAAVGFILYLAVKQSLLNQMERHLGLLQPLIGKSGAKVRTLHEREVLLAEAVDDVCRLIDALVTAVDRFVPHYRALADAGQYLSQRTDDGLAAARQARGRVAAVVDKQQEIVEQMSRLADRTGEEVALTHQLSASLEEMAEAVEHSNSRFHDTTATVDRLALSLRQAATESGEIARRVATSSRDLDSIGEALTAIRREAAAGSAAVGEVKGDAEDGLRIVDATLRDMERIAGESQQAMKSMEHLARQAEEVGKIIKVIRELVSDTELLAFNAAIIAAQAGAEGRGFSVVAEEIRDLADRTSNSAEEIERIVAAIASDTAEAGRTVEAAGTRIMQGKAQSEQAGLALRKIVESSGRAVGASHAIVEATESQEQRCRSVIATAAENLSAVQQIVRIITEQQGAAQGIQRGVGDMKAAADHIARGMDEQLRAKRELDRGLEERGGQIQAVNGAVQFQMATTAEVFAHFAASEERLAGNAERAEIIRQQISAMESLAEELRHLAAQRRAALTGE